MTELDSMKSFFEQGSSGDEVIFEDQYGKIHSGELKDDNPAADQYVFGPYERGEYITLDGSTIRLREAQSGGDLKPASGDIATTLVNKTTGNWVGENQSFANRLI